MNKIWLFLLIVSISIGFLNHSIIDMNRVIGNIGKDTLTIVMPLIAMSCFFNGWLNVARKAGFMDGLIKWMGPFLNFAFPDLKKEKEALGYIASNMIMNLFGLGSAATASGLKAMQYLQACNPDKTTASRSMITFIILNTAGITLFANTVMSLRAVYGAANPADFLPFAFLSSFIAFVVVLIVDKIIHALR